MGRQYIRSEALYSSAHAKVVVAMIIDIGQ